MEINDYLTNDPDIKCNCELTTCKRPREMFPSKSEGKETKKIKLDQKDVPSSSSIKLVVTNIVKRGRPTKSQSGLESEVTSPKVVKKPLSNNVEHHHSKHVQTCSVSKSVENGEFTQRIYVCNFKNEGNDDPNFIITNLQNPKHEIAKNLSESSNKTAVPSNGKISYSKFHK